MKTILDEKGLAKAIEEIASAITKDNPDIDNLVLIGVRKRGDVIAKRLVGIIEKKTGKKVPLGVLDITLYRDDLTGSVDQPVVGATDIPFSIDAKGVVLVDDVLYTGRTIRSALNAIIDFGRPKYVRLASVMDRGLRELPINPDYVAEKLKTKPEDKVQLMLEETDGKDAVIIE